MNPQTRDEAVTLGKGIAASFTSSTPCEVALFAPFPFIEATQTAVGSSGVIVGAEMAHYEAKGAFTGAVSVEQLSSIGVKWVLAGHSERRSIFGDTDTEVNKQSLNLLKKGMNVMLCIGETKEEYESGLVESVCTLQLKKALAGVVAEEMERVVIAYEPVWAIGTGLTCPAAEAQAVHRTCRSVLTKIYGDSVAQDVRILYGGSVTPDTVDELMGKPDIDGALVGGASLDAKKFSRIVNFEKVV